MNLDYRLIQYVVDPTRGEGRNVGVVAHGDGKAYYRGLGVGKDGQVDTSYFQALSPNAWRHEWVYKEWAAWFQTMAENEGRNPDQFDKLMRELERPAAGIVARQGGLLEVPDGEDPDKAMDWLFKRVVSLPRRRQPALIRRAEQLLNESCLADRSDLRRDIEIEFAADGNGPAEVVRFSYLVENVPRVVFKVIRCNDRSDPNGPSEAAHDFEVAARKGFVSIDRCIALIDGPTDDDILAPLRHVSRIIDCREPHAESLLSEILTWK